MYRKFVFDNGLRVVMERMPGAKSVTIGMWVNVGSRDERAGEEGLSHFLEHMFFKGTKKRSASQISREIDALGGEMNAFTGRETTTFYVKVLDQHLVPAVALLADLFHHSQFNGREVQKEKQVVLEEVRMVQDDPEDFVQDLHTQQTFPNHPLGRPILGKPASITQWHRRDLFRYVDTHYHPIGTILAAAGNFDPKELTPLLQRSFGSFTRPDRRRAHRWPPVVGSGTSVHRKRLEQAHICIGLKGVHLDHKDRYAAYALNAILGGSVSSRLFQEIREKRGLAYSIYSYASSFSDVGTMTIYAATRPSESKRVIELICREVKRLRKDGIPPSELQRTQNQLKGNLMLSLEGTLHRMSKLAKDELYQGGHVPLERIITEIDRVSEDQILRLVRELFDPAFFSITALGPITDRRLDEAVSV